MARKSYEKALSWYIYFVQDLGLHTFDILCKLSMGDGSCCIGLSQCWAVRSSDGRQNVCC